MDLEVEEGRPFRAAPRGAHAPEKTRLLTGASPGSSSSDDRDPAPPAARRASGPYPDLGGAFTPLYQRLVELGVAPRVTHMGKIGPRGRSADFLVDDPAGFLRDLEATGRFCVDTPVGRILHRGKTSLREDRTTQSLHVAVDDDGRVLAHLDRYSPVASARRGRSCRYAPHRVAIHNTARVFGDLVRLIFGHRVDCAPLLLSLRDAALEPAACVEEPPDSGAGSGTPGRPLREVTRDDGGSPPPTLAPPSTSAFVPGFRTRFSPIDEAVYLLDSAVEPWSIHWEVRVSGRLDEDRLRSALREALARHPMARARRAATSGSARWHEWEIAREPDVEPLTVVECPDDGSLGAARARLASLALPLVESPPLRMLLAHHPAGDAVMLNLSHVVSDTVGGLRLLRSIARAYSGEPDPLPDLDPLAARDVPPAPLARGLSTRRAWMRLLLDKTRDFVAVPARVVPDEGADLPGYGIHQLALGAEQMERLLRRRGSEAVRDVLLGALHLSIALWNIEHGVRCGRVSVLTPVNLRPHGWRHEVVGNLSLLARVATTPQLRSLAKVVPAVADQTRQLGEEKTLAMLVELVGRTASLPNWAKRALPALLAITGNRLVDTAALSYIGSVQEPPSFGPDGGEAVALWFSPPARMPLGLSVGAVVAAGRLHVAFRYRHPLFGGEAACRFADHFVSLLAHLLDHSGDSQPPPTDHARERDHQRTGD